MDEVSTESTSKVGILPKQGIEALITAGHLHADTQFTADQIQPASLDLRIGTRAYRLRASFLPGKGRSVSECLGDVVMHEIDLTEDTVFETGCVYLVALQESLSLPKELSARANPKSSTGRLDVFTRVIADDAEQFESIEAGYEGPLYVEIAPRTFSVLTRPGEKLVQIRFRQGNVQILRSQTISIDLKGQGSGIIGWRARRHSGLVKLAGAGAHAALSYWEPLKTPEHGLILDPGEFYILASKEAVQIPVDEAAEMAPIAPEIGEFRAHYAGFFDPGFGLSAAGGENSRAVLEVRGHDVPFLLRHGQPVAKLDFEPMTAAPDILYGQIGSHYQAQGLKLSKHFTI